MSGVTSILTAIRQNLRPAPFSRFALPDAASTTFKVQIKNHKPYLVLLLLDTYGVVPLANAQHCQVNRTFNPSHNIYNKPRVRNLRICFTSPKFTEILKPRLPCLVLNSHDVVHTYISISSTGVRKTKQCYIVLISSTFVIFKLSTPNIRLLQGKVIHATRSNGSRQRDTSDSVGIFLAACDENQNQAYSE
jgi:hypothetical protein